MMFGDPFPGEMLSRCSEGLIRVLPTAIHTAIDHPEKEGDNMPVGSIRSSSSERKLVKER